MELIDRVGKEREGLCAQAKERKNIRRVAKIARSRDHVQHKLSNALTMARGLRGRCTQAGLHLSVSERLYVHIISSGWFIAYASCALQGRNGGSSLEVERSHDIVLPSHRVHLCTKPPRWHRATHSPSDHPTFLPLFLSSTLSLAFPPPLSVLSFPPSIRTAVCFR